MKLHELVEAYAFRYRRAILQRAAVLLLLGLGASMALAFRLRDSGWDWIQSVGVSTLLELLVATAVVWWVRRHRIPHRAMASHLDRTLGLRERLTTVAEFAHRIPPPTLYPLLLEDAARRFSASQMRVPRVVDHATITLAALMLLLLIWPGRGNVPMRLAQLAATPPPPRPQPPPPERQPGQPTAQVTPRSAEHESGGGQPTEQGQGSPSQPQAAGEQGQEGGQQSQPQGSGSDQQAGQGKSQPSQGQQQGQGSDQPSPGSGQQRPDGGQETTDQRSEPGDRHGQAAQAGRDRMNGERGQQDGGEQRKGSTPQGSQPQAAGSDEQQAADGAKPAGQQGSQGRDQTEPQQGKGQPGTAQPIPSNTQQAPPATGQAGQSGGQSIAGEVTKAQIQQLLKEVSGELKQFQAQLAAANDEPHPDPGTSTDPELYGAPELLDRATGRPLPIQLETDTADTTAERPGGGVGKPSGEASSAAPQVQAEEVQLSEQPLEETPAGRQTIPPEYRPIFERLHQQRETTR